MRAFEARELANRLEGELDGTNVSVSRLAQPGPDCKDAIIVLFDATQASALATFEPGIIVGPSGLSRPEGARALIRVTDPRLALATLLALFDERPLPATGIHPFANVSPDAKVARGARIAAGAVVGSTASIGAGAVIGEGAVVGPGAVVGAHSRLHARVYLADGVKIGARVVIQAGAVIGSDGFGYVPTRLGARKLHHLGKVVVGDDVEIGANTTIDRGTLGDTVIGNRTKIDNLCQIAHNVSIGSDCLIAGQCGIAGSTRVGDRVTFGGGAGAGDHLVIGDDAVIGPGSGVLKNVPAGETWLGYPAQPYRRFTRQSYLVNRLERIWEFVRQQEGKSQS